MVGKTSQEVLMQSETLEEPQPSSEKKWGCHMKHYDAFTMHVDVEMM